MATVIPRESPTVLYRNVWLPLTTGLSSFTRNTKKAHGTQRLSNRFTQTASLEKERHRFKGMTVIIKNIVSGGSAKK